MRLTSTVPAYVALAEIADDAAREIAWTEEYEAAYPGIFDTYHRAWGRHQRCAAASHDVPVLAPGMPSIEDRARRLVQESETFFTAEGLIDDDLDVVLMVGAHTSNGWVTDLDRRATLFLALEFLGEPPHDAVLLTHEALHVAHSPHGAQDWPDDCGSDLFQEGLAVAVPREMHPGQSDSAYLWNDEDHRDWVHECAAAEQAIATRALAELGTPDDELRVRALFTSQDDEKELPPRAGYWLGDRIARRLRERHPLRDLLAGDHATVRSALAAELTPLTRGGVGSG